MAGTSYTRQSSFTDGDTISASLFNNEYNKIVNAFSYASSGTTGHRHDGTAGEGGNIHTVGDQDFLNKIVVDSTNNRVGFFVEVSSSAVEQIRIQDGAVVPVTDSDIDLGTSSLEFKDLFLDGTAHIDTLDVDVNATIAGTLGVTGATTLASTLEVTGTTTLTGNVTTTNNLSVGGNLTVTGTTTFNGGTLTMGDAATDNVVFGADVNSNIIPNTDNTYDLGSSSQEWKDIYINGTAYLDAINFNGTAISATAAELNILDGVTATAAELNILDGVTSTAAELNILDGVTATAAELNILDGVTATASELNILDGVTSTAAELNILDGVTATAAEINIIDGNTSASSVTLADADKVIVNDSGTMVQVSLTDFETYFESSLDTLSNVTTVGALNSGSITSGFGAINNGSSAITTTGTITYGSLSDGTITVTAFVDEDNMSSNSATLIPTQQSVKAYVDAQTNPDLDITTDSGTIAIDLSSETLTVTGGTGINSSATGNAVTLAVDSTVATLTGSQTFTNKVLTSPDINTPDIDGGTIDSTVIGGSTAAAGSFTTVSVDNITIDGTEIDLSSGDLTLDVAGDINLDAAGNSILFKSAGTHFGDITKSGNDLYLNAIVSDGDIYLRGNDGGSTITALQLDMSEAGAATFNNKIIATELDISGNIDSDGIIDGANFKISGAQGSDGQVLTSTGSGVAWESVSGGGSGISDVVSDTSPQLGGNLDVNGNDIVSTSNGAIDLDPNGSGVVVFKGNATRGAGQFKLNCENNSHGITIKGPPHSASASYTLTLPNDDGSSNQVLRTDGSGNLSWIDQLAGVTAITISGELDAGSLDISGDIDVDGTANLDVVDIDGAVDMASTLTVGGVATFSDHIALADSKYVKLGNDADFILYHDGTSNYVQAAKQDSDIILRGNDGGSGVNMLTLDTSAAGLATFNAGATFGDDTGIGGTPAAGYRLDVIDSGATLARIRSTADSDVSQYFFSNGTTATQNIYFGDTGNTAAGGIRYYHNGDNLTFTGRGAGSEMARFDSSGQLSLSGHTTAFDTTGSALGLQLYYETDTGIGTLGTYSSGGTTSLSFHTNSGGGASSEAMRILGSGNVGIGTTNPGNIVEVAGASPIVEINASSGNPELQFSDGGTDEFSIMYDTGANALKFVEGGVGTHVTILDGGNFGLGTTAPAYTLDVDSTIHIGNDGLSGYTHSRLIFDAGATARGAGNFYHNQGDDVEYFAGSPYNKSDSWAITRASTASHADATANVTNALVVVDGTGKMGIGLQSPTSRLHVNDDTDDGYVARFSQDHATGYGVLIDVDGTDNADPALRVDNAAGTVGLFVSQAGNVGIGNTAPTQKLDVTGTVELNNLTVGGAQGSDGQVLTSTGSGVAWEDASGGGGGAWTVISNSTVSSAVSTLEFTSITGYTHYMIDISNLKSSGNKEFQLICEYGGSGSYTESSYVTNKMHTNNASSNVHGELITGASTSRISKDMSDTVGGTVQLWFGNSSSTISFRSAAVKSTGNPDLATGVMSNSGSSERDAAITKIKFSFQSGNIDEGNFTLYGLATS